MRAAKALYPYGLSNLSGTTEVSAKMLDAEWAKVANRIDEATGLPGLITTLKGFVRAEQIRQSAGMGGSHNPRNDEVYEAAGEVHAEAMTQARAILAEGGAS